MSGDGSDMAHMPANEGDSSIMQKRENSTLIKPQRNGPLKIHGTLNDVLKVAVKVKQKKEDQNAS